MNRNQKRVLIVMVVIIFSMMFYPPFYRVGRLGGVSRRWYSWLFSTNTYGGVDIALLLAQWLGVLLVGGIIFIVLKDDKK